MNDDDDRPLVEKLLASFGDAVLKLEYIAEESRRAADRAREALTALTLELEDLDE